MLAHSDPRMQKNMKPKNLLSLNKTLHWTCAVLARSDPRMQKCSKTRSSTLFSGSEKKRSYAKKFLGLHKLLQWVVIASYEATYIVQEKNGRSLWNSQFCLLTFHYIDSVTMVVEINKLQIIRPVKKQTPNKVLFKPIFY